MTNENDNPVVWFKHCTERMNYWQRELDRNPHSVNAQLMVNMFSRQRIIAYGLMTPCERKRL